MPDIYATTETGNLKPYMRLLLDAAAFYKGDADSVQQAELIIAHEFERYQALGAEQYTPSPLLKDLLHAARKRSSQVLTAGYVGLAILGLKAHEQKPSISRAMKGTATLFAQHRSTPMQFYDFEKRLFVENPVNVPTSYKKVKNAYQEFAPVIHLCAARLISTLHLEPMPPFEAAPMADHCLLTTVITYQGFFAEFDTTMRDSRAQALDIFDVGLNDGFAFQGPKLELTGDLMQPLMDAVLQQ
ncbi:MAG: hypothetical protein AAGL23_02220 [Pseudomonadota bacterium]